MIHRHATQIQAFRETLNDARSIANALPGGEMLIEEQEEVIAMLERLRAKKRYVDFFNNYQPSLPRELIEIFFFSKITVARLFGKGDRY